MAKLQAFRLQLFSEMNIYAGRFQDSTECLFPSNLQYSLIEHFVVSSLFQFLMTSSEFTEHFPGLNKVHYPISDRKDLTLLLTSVVGRQNYINV